MPVRGGTLFIETEDEAWSLLQELVFGFSRLPKDVRSIKFGSWVRDFIYLPDEVIHASISAPIMEGLIEFQKCVYRTYSVINKGSSDLKRINKSEKKPLLIKFTLHPGSSDVKSASDGPLEILVHGMADKMPQDDWLILGITISILLFGGFIISLWINRKFDFMEHREERATRLDASKQETERLKVFAAVSDRRFIQDIQPIAGVAAASLVRAAASADRAVIRGTEITPSIAADVLAKEKIKGKGVRLSGEYYVNKINVDYDPGFMFSFTDKKSGEIMDAEVNTLTLPDEEVATLWRASQSKESVQLEMNAFEVGGKITHAFVIRIA
jgi:hypothetical protein